MGLITKEVEVKLNNAKIKYYEDKGYNIPRSINKSGKYQVKRGTSILVKIEDLTDGSGINVKCICDNCNKIYDISYHHYKKYNHDGKTYCKQCCCAVLNSRENHWNWNKDKTEEERIIGRRYPEYIEFTKNVLARDNYTCVICGEKASDVHHLYGYSGFPEYRIDVKNSVSCCENCHKLFHS